MHVTVKLFANLRENRFDVKECVFPEGITPGEIIGRLGIPAEDVTLVFVNGRHGEAGVRLADGDTLALFPPIGGG